MKTLFQLATLAILALTAACSTEHEGHDLPTVIYSVSSGADFELWKNHQGQWYFDMSSTNGESLLYSEGYRSRSSALGGILSVLDNAKSTSQFRIQEGVDGLHYISLRAANHKTIAVSEGYATRSNAQRAIATNVYLASSFVAPWDQVQGARVQIATHSDGRYRFDVFNESEEFVLSSESYKSKGAALGGSYALHEYGQLSDAYEIVEDGDGLFRVQILAANHRVLAFTGVFDTEAAALSAQGEIIELISRLEML